MTQKAIELLSQDENGFFLMVEGSQVDWAGHGNDPIYNVTDFLAFDEAVKAAVDFAEQDQHTVVLAFPDHNTGGMSLGNKLTDGSYTDVSIEDLVYVLNHMQITAFGCARKIAEFGDNVKWWTVQDVLKQWWGIDVSKQQAKEIIALAENIGLDYAIAVVVSRDFTIIGWTTHGHVGQDVPLWACEPDQHGTVAGHYDNTGLALLAADAMSCDLETINDELFVDVDTAGFDSYSIDWTDPANGVLVVHYDGKEARLPLSKNTLEMDSTEWSLEGIVVYAPATGKVYIPQEAVDTIKS